MVSLAIVNCGSGNLRSVQKSFEKLGANAVICDDPIKIKAADAIVLPGVGAFSEAMQTLANNSLVSTIQQQVLEEGKPILGICLGMQLLANSNEEGEGCEGLKLIQAHVTKLDITTHKNWNNRSLKLPHMGWNNITVNQPSQLFNGLDGEHNYYFVHNFHVNCEDTSIISATCDYGETFICAIESNNIFGAQFHPEKSQKSGQKLLSNFLAIVNN